MHRGLHMGCCLEIVSATATTSARSCPPFDSEMMPPKETDVLSPSTSVCISQLPNMRIPTNPENHQPQFLENVSHHSSWMCESAIQVGGLQLWVPVFCTIFWIRHICWHKEPRDWGCVVLICPSPQLPCCSWSSPWTCLPVQNVCYLHCRWSDDLLSMR